MLHLELVTESTFKKIVDMKLPPEQDCFVAPNVVSLAQAWLYYKNARPYAICNDNNVVGFIMLDWDEGERTVGIWRFMIAPEHQQKGYGRKAMETVIKLVREAGMIDLIHLSFVPNNKIAHDLYCSLGFRENGDVEDGEIVMEMPLTDNPKVGMLIADDEDMEDFIELIESEKEAGSSVPAEFENSSFIEKAIADGNVKRFTVMGKTIGLAVNGVMLIDNQNLSYLAQAMLLMNAQTCS